MSDTAPAPAEQAAASKPARIPLVLPSSCFAASAPVVKMVPLQFGPVTFAGRDWTKVGIRRLSVEQIEAVFANYRANLAQDPDFPLSMPVYVDDQGGEIPDGLLRKLDPDDADTLDGEAADFLPRRYRVARDPTPSTPPTGSATAPSSSA